MMTMMKTQRQQMLALQQQQQQQMHLQMLVQKWPVPCLAAHSSHSSKLPQQQRELQGLESRTLLQRQQLLYQLQRLSARVATHDSTHVPLQCLMCSSKAPRSSNHSCLHLLVQRPLLQQQNQMLLRLLLLLQLPVLLLLWVLAAVKLL
jgi:hypothetical protein